MLSSCAIVENGKIRKKLLILISSQTDHRLPIGLYDSIVQVDCAVELGRDDPTLDVPWEDPEGSHRYFDLKRYPELLREVPEAVQYPELREFLTAVNSPACFVETAKSDVWSTTEMNTEEDIFEAAYKFGSYVDLLFDDGSLRSSFEAHERFTRDLAQLLKKAPEIPASAEFLIRRCYYRSETAVSDAFFITFYLFGYADSEDHARKQWAIALKLVENAIRQTSTKAKP